jgi:hypothetical protein
MIHGSCTRRHRCPNTVAIAVNRGATTIAALGGESVEVHWCVDPLNRPVLTIAEDRLFIGRRCRNGLIERLSQGQLTSARERSLLFTDERFGVESR